MFSGGHRPHLYSFSVLFAKKPKSICIHATHYWVTSTHLILPIPFLSVENKRLTNQVRLAVRLLLLLPVSMDSPVLTRPEEKRYRLKSIFKITDTVTFPAHEAGKRNTGGSLSSRCLGHVQRCDDKTESPRYQDDGCSTLITQRHSIHSFRNKI